jgi:hypothetical protein
MPSDRRTPEATSTGLAETAGGRHIERVNRRPSILRRAIEGLADVSVVGSFSALGYRLRAPTFDPADTAVDLRGRVVVVTGASSGIGLSAARTFAGRGATVVMVAANPLTCPCRTR